MPRDRRGGAGVRGDTGARRGRASRTRVEDARSGAPLQLSLGEHTGLVANKLESPELLTVPHLAVEATVVPPATTLVYTFQVSAEG